MVVINYSDKGSTPIPCVVQVMDSRNILAWRNLNMKSKRISLFHFEITEGNCYNEYVVSEYNFSK